MRRQSLVGWTRVWRSFGMALMCGALAPITASAQPAGTSAAQPAGAPAASSQQAPASPAASGPPTAVKFYGSPSSPISSGVIIPANAAFLWTSGTVPPVVDKEAKPDDRARFGGDTKAQALGILKAFEQQLAQHGLTMKDVVYLRAYLVPDPTKGGKIDTDGWNEAYKQYFGTEANPTKTARSTVGVAALVNPAWLIEVEAFAVFPAK